MARNFQQVYYVCKIPRDGGYTQAKRQETELKKVVIKKSSLSAQNTQRRKRYNGCEEENSVGTRKGVGEIHATYSITGVNKKCLYANEDCAFVRRFVRFRHTEGDPTTTASLIACQHSNSS